MTHHRVKLVLTVLAALLTSGLLNGQTTRPSPQNDTAQALEKLERDWAAAVMKCDVERINQIQADDFVFVGPSGELWTKTRAIDFVKSGALQLKQFEMSEFKVQIYGDVALVRFRVFWTATSGGQDVSGPQRMTDVFVQRDGRWQCVASQTTRIATQ